jgi:Protein of unknown function (DUF3738).
LILKVQDAARLNSFRTKGGPFACYGIGDRDTQVQYFTNAPLSFLANQLVEGYFQKPCVDQTDLKIKYDFKIQWEANIENKYRDHSSGAARSVIEEQINQMGLELVPANMPIEMLVVEKEK